MAADSAATMATTAPAAPAPATNVSAKDKDNDGGKAVIVSWTKSVDDMNGRINGYKVLRGLAPSGPFDTVGSAVSGAQDYTDNNAQDGVEYYYRVDAYTEYLDQAGLMQTVSTASDGFGPVSSSPQWFNSARGITLLLFLIIATSVLQFITQAKSGRSNLWYGAIIFGLVLTWYTWGRADHFAIGGIFLVIVIIALAFFYRDLSLGSNFFVRKIAGIDAVEEAVGRATEMGKKIFFIPGIQDMNDVQTIAGMAILGRVAAVAAEYETWLEVPVCKSMVMVTARETMKEAYSKVGRPDLFQEGQVHFVTEDQFGYAAALDGMFVREKPATIFFMGAFFAESLILAETGNEAGAIQIAGTAMPSQLPFFVAACDYTLIGEELFAASAYLSREPRQLGSLKGQDVGKAVFLTALVFGIIIALIGE
ncbi:MAG TPA: DUF6754 domain-containing protein, partial [candidate division Zixibacteria bacterium]|nr:DUF6754 domain-containing protein [candidate division Zixibacteria bacterium]